MATSEEERSAPAAVDDDAVLPKREAAPLTARASAARGRRVERGPRAADVRQDARAVRAASALSQVNYAAVCCRTGCTWQAPSTRDKLEAIRAGRQHEAEHRPELHITTIIHIDEFLRAAA